MPSLLWFRNDLRLADNPALRAAIKHGAVVPVYLYAPHEEHPWEPGGATRWWLHHSLTALDTELHAAGSRLIVRAVPRGETSLQTLEALLKETESTAVFWNRRYEPANIKHDTETKGVLRSRGITVESFNGSLLLEAGSVSNQQGSPFQVFTPFWKACLAKADAIPTLLPKPREVPGPKSWPKSHSIDELGQLPKIKWDAGLAKMWTPGEAGAHARFKQFLHEPINTYKSAPRYFRPWRGHQCCRRICTSAKSARGKFGTSCKSETKNARPCTRKRKRARQIRRRSLPPRGRLARVCVSLAVSFSGHSRGSAARQVPGHPLAQGSSGRARSHGLETRPHGLPDCRCGMRQLWHTGWMHNRVRMIVGSFLVKHLLLPWQDGAAWFWDTLVDADLGNNTLGCNGSPVAARRGAVLSDLQSGVAGSEVRRRGQVRAPLGTGVDDHAR